MYFLRLSWDFQKNLIERLRGYFFVLNNNFFYTLLAFVFALQQ